VVVVVVVAVAVIPPSRPFSRRVPDSGGSQHATNGVRSEILDQ
jgi:hypothetical protein